MRPSGTWPVLSQMLSPCSLNLVFPSWRFNIWPFSGFLELRLRLSRYGFRRIHLSVIETSLQLATESSSQFDSPIEPCHSETIFFGGVRGQRPFVKKPGFWPIGRFYVIMALKSCTSILENSCQRKGSSNFYSEQY